MVRTRRTVLRVRRPTQFRRARTQRTSRSCASAPRSSSPTIPPLHRSVARSARAPPERSNLPSHAPTTRAPNPPVMRNSPPPFSPRQRSSILVPPPLLVPFLATRRADHYPLPASIRPAAARHSTPSPSSRSSRHSRTPRSPASRSSPRSQRHSRPPPGPPTRECPGLPPTPPSRAARVTTWRSPSHNQQRSACSSPRAPIAALTLSRSAARAPAPRLLAPPHLPDATAANTRSARIRPSLSSRDLSLMERHMEDNFPNRRRTYDHLVQVLLQGVVPGRPVVYLREAFAKILQLKLTASQLHMNLSVRAVHLPALRAPVSARKPWWPSTSSTSHHK
ncbi:hypothetical protein Efla_006024 [Eimeria flavescens]